MRLNKNYTEDSLGLLASDFAMNLALQMQNSGFKGDKILISDKETSFEAFEEDEMNTVRKTLLLLVIAVSNYEDTDLIEKGVVHLPEEAFIDGMDKEKGGDIFENFPFTAKIYCLYKGYHILTKKLSERNTPLFRVLYMCICLELWRLQAPPEVIVGPIGVNVHWGSVINAMTGNFSDQSQKNLAHGGFGSFIKVLEKEVDKLSSAEIPNNILQHFYATQGVGTKNETLLVQNYLQSIMTESRRQNKKA